MFGAIGDTSKKLCLDTGNRLLFDSAAANSTSGLFGSKPAASTTSIFGSSAGNTAATNTSFNVFGSQPTATTAPLFGSSAGNTATANSSPTILGGKRTAATPLFGSSDGTSQNSNGNLAANSTAASSITTTAAPLTATTTAPSTVTTTAPSTVTTTAPSTVTSTFGSGASVLGSRLSAPTAPSVTVPNIPKLDVTNAISFGELEKVVNNLIMDVLSHEKIFLNQALEVNSYDREIRDNQNKLVAADKEVTALEESRDRLLHNLNFIDMQQKELEELVVGLEKKLSLPDWTDCTDPFPLDFGYAVSADQQRTNIMKLLTSVDAQIKEADDDLNEVSEQLTTLSAAKDSANGDINSAAQQIQKVLSKQLENIMWIDRKTEEITQKVSKLSNTFASMPDA